MPRPAHSLGRLQPNVPGRRLPDVCRPSTSIPRGPTTIGTRGSTTARQSTTSPVCTCATSRSTPGRYRRSTRVRPACTSTRAPTPSAHSSFPQNTCPAPSTAPNVCHLPVHITSSGWYTFRHTFRAEAGSLAVDMEIFNARRLRRRLDDLPGRRDGDRRREPIGWLANEEIPELRSTTASAAACGSTSPRRPRSIWRARATPSRQRRRRPTPIIARRQAPAWRSSSR